MLTLKQILVPTDSSEASKASVQYAAELAALLGARLHVLHVRDAAGTATPFVPGRIDRGSTDASGSPAVQIVRYAKERDIDLIVMGTPVRPFDAHARLDSVTEDVVRGAPCAVLTLPWWSFAAALASRRPTEQVPALSVSS